MDSSRLTAHSIRSSEDFHMDTLIGGGKTLGLPVLAANFPRAYLDVNREPFELDPVMFDETLPEFANTQSHRVTSGLGTIARIVAENQPIYKNKISLRDALTRIDRLYKPYHNALRRLLIDTQTRFGFAVLIDCHSMPSTSTGLSLRQRPDLILGDRFGNSCSPQLVYNARSILETMGYRVEVNRPYAGGFITEHYGKPDLGLHALQIEINRGIYMNEASLKKSDHFSLLASDLTNFFDAMINSDWRDLDIGNKLAAE